MAHIISQQMPTNTFSLRKLLLLCPQPRGCRDPGNGQPSLNNNPLHLTEWSPESGSHNIKSL